MQSDKVYRLCPYLDANREGPMCNAAEDLLQNIKDINLKLCMSRKFESCSIYVSKLKEINNVPTSPPLEENLKF